MRVASDRSRERFGGPQKFPRNGVVLGTQRFGPRLFRPWAEYIIVRRLVKLVQSTCSKLCESSASCLTTRLNKQDFISTEPIILAVDTSSIATSLAVARGAELISSIDERHAEKRSETLWTQIHSLLERLELELGDVDVFGVCIGPGGFTGVRVGMAAMQGFSTATGKPVIGVTSLEAGAFGARPVESVCALVNAYKGEVYSQLFSFDASGIPVAVNEPLVSSFDEALKRVEAVTGMVLTGDAVETGIDVIRNVAAFNANGWTIKQSDQPLAGAIAGVAYLKHSRGDAQTAETLRACYVRPSEAEIKLSLGLLGSKIKRSMKSG